MLLNYLILYKVKYFAPAMIFRRVTDVYAHGRLNQCLERLLCCHSFDGHMDVEKNWVKSLSKSAFLWKELHRSV